jgi:hypothetical protein
MRQHKLRHGVNWQGLLKQRSIKEGMGVYVVCATNGKIKEFPY